MKIQLALVVLIALIYVTCGEMLMKNPPYAEPTRTVASFHEQFSCSGGIVTNCNIGCCTTGAVKMYGRFSGKSISVKDNGSSLRITLHSNGSCGGHVFQIDWRKGTCYSSNSEAPVLQIGGTRYWRGSVRSTNTHQEIVSFVVATNSHFSKDILIESSPPVEEKSVEDAPEETKEVPNTEETVEEEKPEPTEEEKPVEETKDEPQEEENK
eukprot:gene5266-8884_t